MKLNLTAVLLGIYGLTLGFFLGILLMGVTPFTWPYNIVASYIFGGLMGLFVAFPLIKKWQLSPAIKCITALIILIFVAAVSVRLHLLSFQITNLDMILLTR